MKRRSLIEQFVFWVGQTAPKFNILNFINMSYHEIGNWNHVRRVIKKNKNTQEWKYYKLKANVFGKIGTVVNIPPEYQNISTNVFVGQMPIQQEQYVTINKEQIPVSHLNYVGSQLKELMDIYFLRLDLINVDLSISRYKEPNTFAYVVEFTPTFEYFTITNILKYSLLASLLVLLEMKYDVINYILS